MSNNKGSVIMVTSRYRKTGGHESVINSLAIQLQKIGYEVSIGAYYFELDPPNNVSKVKLSHLGRLLDRSAFHSKDIVHSHQTQMNYHSLILNKPLIFHYHGISDNIQKCNLKLCFALLKNRIIKTISVSQSSNSDLQKIVGIVPSEIIHNGVDTNVFKPGQEGGYRKGEPQLLFVGNLHPYKNVRYLIEMMPNFLRKYPRSHLSIIGDGRQYNEIKIAIQQKGLSRNIELFGQVPHHALPSHYNSCDVYISASLKETSDLPALEAMASGKPVALSDIPSHRELVAESGAGNLFSVLVDQSIINCIDNVYQKRTFLGKAALNFAALHDWSSAAKKVSRLYEQVTISHLS